MFKKLYQFHIYAGIFVTLHLAIFGVTGLLLLFKDEIVALGNPGAQRSQTMAPIPRSEMPAKYEAIIRYLEREYPRDRVLAMYPDDHHPHLVTVRLGVDGSKELRGSRRVTTDLSTGQKITEPPTAAAGFFHWTLRLHRELFLGSSGKLYVGFVGLIYVALLCSGLWIYGNFMKGRRAGQIRAARTLRWRDLHKFVGITTFGWSFVVGLSGAFLAFNGVLIKLFQARSLHHLSERYGYGQIDSGLRTSVAAPFGDVVSAALAGQPASTISYISFPATEFGIAGHYLFLMNGTTALTERISELLVMDAISGQIAEVVHLPLYLKLVLLSEPLHFGDYGGLPLKIIWALFTVGSLAVAFFGVASYLLKRRGVASYLLKRRRTRVSEETAAITDIGKNSSAVVIDSRRPYLVPLILTAMTILSLIGLLFAGHWHPALVFVLLAILIIPILFFFFGRRHEG